LNPGHPEQEAGIPYTWPWRMDSVVDVGGKTGTGKADVGSSGSR
jgi:hypothetical protein